MLQQIRTNKFNKEVKLAQKRGKNMDKLKIILLKLVFNEKLEEKHKDHKLTSNYEGCRECHIEPDWLLIYKIIDNQVIFERTGSHTDLFK